MVYDLVHLYLDVLDVLPYERITLLGLSFSGFGHLMMIGRSRFMTHAEAEQGITRFAKEVLPRLREIAPVTAG